MYLSECVAHTALGFTLRLFAEKLGPILQGPLEVPKGFETRMASSFRTAFFPGGFLKLLFGHITPGLWSTIL